MKQYVESYYCQYLSIIKEKINEEIRTGKRVVLVTLTESPGKVYGYSAIVVYEED